MGNYKPDIKIGTKLKLRPRFTCPEKGELERFMIGKVNYINWDHRYFRAQFMTKCGKLVNESFKFECVKEGVLAE